MKKIECHISDDKSSEIDKICDIEGYTRAEFNRKAVELLLMSIKGINTSTDCVNLENK